MAGLVIVQIAFLQLCVSEHFRRTKIHFLLFSSSLLLEGYYYSGGSNPGPLDEAFLQQDHRFVTDSVTKDVLNEPSTRAALSSELGYALGYSVDGATPTEEPAADTSKLNFIAIYRNGMHCVQWSALMPVSVAAGHHSSRMR